MNKKINAEEVLQLLATIRASVPFELKPRPDKGSAATFEAVDADSIEGFELVTVAEALEDLANELSDAVDGARQKALAEALKIYYAAEELARDPAHAELIPHVQAMREAYERDFGKPIPPKK
ncbi:MAG TPA: hypothetical protein VJZ76_14935 [Thermoanaerobaculia bacterium]|nr:hypothetical protein [Thermoanaerobaculia bacterium]